MAEEKLETIQKEPHSMSTQITETTQSQEGIEDHTYARGLTNLRLIR